MKKLLLFFAMALAIGCSSSGTHGSITIESRLQDISTDFFSRLSEQGTVARAGVALFIPEGNVHKRHIKAFRDSLERDLRRDAPLAGLNFQGSAERVFFLSEQRAKGWEEPEGSHQNAALLAQEFRNGTALGWTAFHAYWAQLNHLITSGNADFINALPGSLRADLTNPLHYVLRVDVAYISQIDLVTHEHRIDFQLIEIGSERVFYAKSYPVTLSAKITE